jgi:hypothetical protein
VAAALVGGAEVIVTANFKDFPLQRIPEPIKIICAAEFAADTVTVSPDVALGAVQIMARRFYTPPQTVDQTSRRWPTCLNIRQSRLPATSTATRATTRPGLWSTR